MPSAKMPSMKRIQINRANATLMIVLGVAAFISIFCLVTSKSLLEQRSYQSRVITKQKQAKEQLDRNVKASQALTNSFQGFIDPVENIIGGSSFGEEDRDGDNARIVLDALPSKYDFPALVTSISKLLADPEKKIQVTSIQGTDNEIAQSATQPSAQPAPIEIPFSVQAKTSADNGTKLLERFERSIRPIQIQKLSISSQGGQIQLSVTAKTYFQAEKILEIKSEVVK